MWGGRAAGTSISSRPLLEEQSVLAGEEPMRKVNVQRGMFRAWLLFSVLWGVGFLALASLGWYSIIYYSFLTRSFQMSERKNPQTNKIDLIVKSSSGCSYLVSDDKRIGLNPKIAFSYVTNYEKRAHPDCSPAKPWLSEGLLSKDPKNGYDADEVVLLSPYPNLAETEALTILGFAVPAALGAGRRNRTRPETKATQGSI
jgi:hypothetical protein